MWNKSTVKEWLQETVDKWFELEGSKNVYSDWDDVVDSCYFYIGEALEELLRQEDVDEIIVVIHNMEGMIEEAYEVEDSSDFVAMLEDVYDKNIYELLREMLMDYEIETKEGFVSESYRRAKLRRRKRIRSLSRR